jgi:hypothetical protein
MSNGLRSATTRPRMIALAGFRQFLPDFLPDLAPGF